MPEASSLVLKRRKKPRHRSGPPIGREFRRFAATGLEIRAASDGSDSIVIAGTPIVYETPYTVCDMFGEFTETMHAGVATNVLAGNPDVRFLFNHDGMPLARTISGTLTLQDGPTGLGILATVDARQGVANDLAVAIERGDVSQMSCGFIVAMDTWNADYTQRDIWRLDELFDVSAVTYPASPTTSVELALRSMMATPVESRARIRVAWKAAREAREGKMLSAENADLLQQALEALHNADDVDIPAIVSSLQTIDEALDAGQAGLAAVLDKANPDDDDAGEDRDDEDEDAGMEDGTDGTSQVEAPGVADATGSRSQIPATRQERRAADRSFNDIQQAVSTALNVAYAGDGDWCDLWMCDCGDTWVVFQSWEDNPGVGMWRQSYSIDANGVVTLLDDATQVVEQTSYIPVTPAERSRSVALELEAERLRLRRRRF